MNTYFFNDWSDDDDDEILPFRSLNSPKQSDDNDDDDDGSSKTKKQCIDQLDTNFLRDNNTFESRHSDLMIKRVTSMRNAFMRYCRQLHVIGFNSEKYEL